MIYILEQIPHHVAKHYRTIDASAGRLNLIQLKECSHNLFKCTFHQLETIQDHAVVTSN